MISRARSRLIRRLRSRRGRPREELVLVEGIRAAEDALDAGLDVSFAAVSPRLGGSVRGAALERRLRGGGIDLETVEEEELVELSDTEAPQGVILVCAEPAHRLDDLAATSGWGVLVLDAVQDPGNAGTLIRAALAFGLRGAVALDGTVDPWNPKAVRASAGASFRVPVVREAWNTVEAWCRGAGLRILVSDPAGADVAGEEAKEEWALVVGNEGSGVRREILEAADRVLGIPMKGGAESLNAGVAGAILVYALVRGRGS